MREMKDKFVKKKVSLRKEPGDSDGGRENFKEEFTF